jgi:hypothetical protein
MESQIGTRKKTRDVATNGHMTMLEGSALKPGPCHSGSASARLIRSRLLRLPWDTMLISAESRVQTPGRLLRFVQSYCLGTPNISSGINKGNMAVEQRLVTWF